MYAFGLYRLQQARALILGLIFAVTSGVVAADEFDVESTASTLFKSFTGTHSLDAPLDIDPEAAIAVQDFYIALLRPTWGMDVGYAAHATEVENVSNGAPTGILLENMFTGTRSVIDRSFGINMQAAAELYFRVKSEDLNSAQTRTEALMALESVIPGVRLSDALMPGASDRGRPFVSATNLEVRMCVLGAPLQLNGDLQWIERLDGFSVTMLDENKQQIDSNQPPLAVHPLDAVLATRDSLLARGIELIAGDVLAIGTLTDAHEISELSRLRVEFDGLAADQQQVFVYMGFR